MFKISEVYLKTIKEYEESSDGSQQLVSRKAYLSRDGLINWYWTGTVLGLPRLLL